MEPFFEKNRKKKKKINKNPPETPHKRHLAARGRPDLQNSSKMTPPTPQSDAPDPPFWIDFDFTLKYIFTTILLHFGIVFGVDFTSQAQWRIRTLLRFGSFCLFLLGGARLQTPPDIRDSRTVCRNN